MEYSKKVEVVNKAGFHLRAAAVFVKEAEKFKADIKVLKDDMEAEGKSLLGLTTLGAVQGIRVELKASGADAKEAVAALAKLIMNKFGESE